MIRRRVSLCYSESNTVHFQIHGQDPPASVQAYKETTDRGWFLEFQFHFLGVLFGNANTLVVVVVGICKVNGFRHTLAQCRSSKFSSADGGSANQFCQNNNNKKRIGMNEQTKRTMTYIYVYIISIRTAFPSRTGTGCCRGGFTLTTGTNVVHIFDTLLGVTTRYRLIRSSPVSPTLELRHLRALRTASANLARL